MAFGMILIVLGVNAPPTNPPVAKLRAHFKSFDDKIRPWLLNPPLFVVYALCHAVNFVVLASSMERLAKIVYPKPKGDDDFGGILCFNCLGCMLESVPQLACQIAFMGLSQNNTFAILSMALTVYKLLGSMGFKMFRAFCGVVEQDPAAMQAAV
jgi:hypothetical protein